MRPSGGAPHGWGQPREPARAPRAVDVRPVCRTMRTHLTGAGRQVVVVTRCIIS